jgi:MFS family permease
VGTFLQLSVTAGAYAWAAFIRAPSALPLGEVALVAESGWVLAIGCLFLLVMVFPTGRLPSRRWRLPLGLVVAATALLFAGYTLAPSEFRVSQPIGAQGVSPLTVPNPLALSGTLAPLLRSVSTSPFTYAVFLIPLASIVSRIRTAAGNEKQQLKWFAYSSSVVALFFVGSSLVPSFFLTDIGSVVAIIFVDLIPISVAIAILRYRLYDIDALINRTIVYGATSAAIAVTFFLGLVALQAALRPFTSGSEIAVAASTLFSFALFQPIRRRVQDAVNRRFDRARYDAARTVDGFADRLRDEVDLMELRADLLGEVQLTMAPAHVSLWLRDQPR